jgi:hypothetical protein
MKFRGLMIAAAAAVVFATTPTQAAVTFHTTLGSFQAATINPQATETFETAPRGSSTWYPNGYTGNGFIVVGNDSYTVTADSQIPGSQSWYDWGSGDSLLYGPGGTATFYFVQPVTAFSLDLATFMNSAGNSTGTVAVAGDGFSTTVNTAYNPTRTFFGLTSDVGLSSFTLKAAGTAYGLADNFALASIIPTAAVPEPAAWAMMLVGFGLVGRAARYRHRRSTMAYA